MDIHEITSVLPTLCELGQSLFGSTYSFLWSIVIQFGLWKDILVVIFVIAWIAWEIGTKNKHKRNSENGFTASFNRFIGASGYFWFQALIYFGLKLIFTDAIYCFKWPYALHSIIFLLNGFILHIIGFWPYWKVFGKKIRIK